jgi:hypothetical protein
MLIISHVATSFAVDPSKWLQMPEQDDSTDEDHLPLTGHGWFSSVNVAGIACE